MSTFIARALGSALLLTFLLIAPALADGPGNIVYTEGGTITVMNADGGGRTALTTGFSGRDPVLSADGLWIAFQAAQTTGPTPRPSGIFVMKAEPMSGTNVPVLVRNGTSYGFRMSWHPGGRWLAFYDEATSEIFALSVLDEAGQITPEFAGNVKTQLTNDAFSSAEDPAFSPDGKYLAYGIGASIALLRVVDDNGALTPESVGNQETRVTLQGANTPLSDRPSWNHDGTKVVVAQVQYDANFENPMSALSVLTVRDALGNVTPETAGNPRVIYTPLEPGVSMYQEPTWSPDGSLIAFVPAATVVGESRGIFKINASGPEHATTNPRMRLTPIDQFSFGPSFAQPGGTPVIVSPAEVPANIVAWYPGDYAQTDIVGAHHATVQNDFTFPAGKVGRGIRFDGALNYATVPDAPELNITGNITIEAWINPAVIGGGTRSIVSKKNNNDATSSFYFNIQNDGTLSFSAQRADATFFNALSTTAIPANEFSHVAATMRGDTVTLYRNGSVIGTLTTTLLRPATTGGEMVVGAKRTQLTPQNMLNSFFHGVIDELSIYNRALSTEEIAGIFAAGAAGKLRDDAARDFFAVTNDAGQLWSYGSMAEAFVPNVATFARFAEPAGSGSLALWRDTGVAAPNVTANTTDTASTLWGPQQLSLEPGPHTAGLGSIFSVVRWTAPAEGTYAIGADFISLDSGVNAASTQYEVWHNNAMLARSSVAGSFTTTPPGHPLSQVITAAAGDHVDFIVGADQSTGNDNTGLFASVVSVPVAEPALLDPIDLDIDFTGVAMSGKTWTFEARQNDFAEHNGRLTLRVQYSATPDDEQSWQDVPGGVLSRVGSVGRHKVELSNQIPVGDFAFRVITSVTGVGDRVTAVSQIFNILAPAPLLELVSEVSAASDPSGATTHRGDLITYTFKYRNVGALPANDLRVETQLPPGIKVKPKHGAFTRSEKPFGPTYYFLYWRIASLAPSDEFQTRSYTAQVLEPSNKTDATLNVIGSLIQSFTSLLNNDRSVFWDNTHLTTTIVNPFVVEAVVDDGTPDQGGYVSFTLTITNKASYTAKKVEVGAHTGDGLFMPMEGDALQFLDDGGQPTGAPIDPATRRTAKFKRGFNPQRTGDDEALQVGRFYVGSMLPGDVQKVRARMQVQYYYNNHNQLDGTPTISVELLKAISFSPAGREIADVADTINLFINRVTNQPRPVLDFGMSQRGAGEYTNPTDKQRIVTVTASGAAVPDVTPKRLSNEITYTAIVFNTGTARVDYLSVLLGIPEHTKYKAKSLLINGERPEKTPEIGDLFGVPVIGVELPGLVGNAPFAAGSFHKIVFTVKVSSRAPIGTRIMQPGGFIGSRSMFFGIFPFLPAPRPLEAEVVRPATMEYEKLNQPADIRPDTQVVTHSVIYHNTGGITATGVGVRYTIPAGLKFQSARFVDVEPVTAAVAAARSISAPAVNATTGSVTFTIGKVTKGNGGVVQVLLAPDPDGITRVASGQETPDGAYRIDAPIQGYDSTTQQPTSFALAERSVRGGTLPTVLPPVLSAFVIAPYFDPTLAKTFAMLIGPASVSPEGEITYKAVWGNLSGVTAGVGAMQIPIPEGTEFVSATDAFSTVNQNDAPSYRAPGELPEFPNGLIAWVTNSAPNSAKVATFIVRVKAGVTGKIVSKGGRLSLDQSGRRYIGDVPTHILDPGQPFDVQQGQIYNSAVGTGANTSLGNASLGSVFAESVRSITTNSMSIGIGGADFARIESNGAMVIPLGGGKLVAAGAGNLITDNGAGLVAAGGGNLVAAGAGNLISIDTPRGLLNGGELISNNHFPQLVAAGGMNLVAAGGGNLVGNDGGSLIGLDGGTLGSFSLGANGASFTPSGGSPIALGAQGTNLVAAGGLNLVAAGGGNLVAAGGMNLINRNGQNLVAAGGLNLLPSNSGGLVAAGGLNLTPQAGGALVAAGAGNFVNSGTGLVAAGAGN